MIVSVTISDNREREIADAIRSVIDHVDRVLLLDTGISDQTVERAKEVAGDKLVVSKHSWVDFSIARNAALMAARALGADWILVVDTDERFNLGERKLRDALEGVRSDIALIESADGHYPKEKLLRATSGAVYVGPTHEVLVGGSKETLRGVTFSEAPKSEAQLKQKFARDVAILSAHVKENPDDPRWWYYLGASYEGLGMRAFAANAFGECVERRKTGVEAAWAGYKQAEQLHMLDRHEEAIRAAARGLGADATFAECAWIAAVSASRLNRAQQAIAWARMAEAVGRFKGCGPPRSWFRHMPALYELPYDVLRYTLPDEAGRAQADADFHAAKLARIGASDPDNLDELSVSRSATESSRYEARSMLRPPPLSEMCPSMHAVRINFEPPGGRLPMNPSICWHKGELWCVVRAVNYTITGWQYSIQDEDGIVRTDNYLGKLLLDGTFLEPRLIRDLDPFPRQPSRIVGYEDIRLASIWDDDRGAQVLAGSATVCDRDPNRRMIARLFFDVDGDVSRADVQVTRQQHEKNWMPITVNGELRWIYSLDPTAVIPGPLRECPFALDHLRGGAATRYDDGYMCVMHEAINADEGRVYLHRFVHLDERFNVQAVSPAWVFNGHGIEFCAGMVRYGDQLVLSYGIKDQEAWIATVDMEEVENMDWIAPP